MLMREYTQDGVEEAPSGGTMSLSSACGLGVPVLALPTESRRNQLVLQRPPARSSDREIVREGRPLLPSAACSGARHFEADTFGALHRYVLSSSRAMASRPSVPFVHSMPGSSDGSEHINHCFLQAGQGPAQKGRKGWRRKKRSKLRWFWLD